MNGEYLLQRNTLRINTGKGSVLIPKSSIEKFGVWVRPVDIRVDDVWNKMYQAEVVVVIKQTSTTYTLWSTRCSSELAAYNEANSKIEQLQKEYENSCI